MLLSKVRQLDTCRVDAMPCYVMLRHATPCYAMLCYAMLSYAMLCCQSRASNLAQLLTIAKLLAIVTSRFTLHACGCADITQDKRAVHVAVLLCID